MSFKNIIIPIFVNEHNDFEVAFGIDNDEGNMIFSFLLKTENATIALTMDEIEDIEKIIIDHFENHVNRTLSPKEAVYEWGSGKVFLDIDSSTITFLEESDNSEINIYLSSDWYAFVEAKYNIEIS